MKILITAGATWIKVDDVRIITNRFTGNTGLYLAKELKKRGHSVTLLVNTHALGDLGGFKVISYRYFDEFKSGVSRLLKEKKFDAIIHTAAVSDYKLKGVKRGKIPSGKKSLVLKLIPTMKIVKIIRTLAKNSILVQFKLEAKRKGMLEAAYKSLKNNNSDYVVANALEDLSGGYKAFLINKKKNVIKVSSKKSLAAELSTIFKAFKA